MRLEKDGQVIDLENENHINAFLASGWAEAKVSAASTPSKMEKDADEVKAEKKPVGRRKQEK